MSDKCIKKEVANDCRECGEWKTCPCGKQGHANKTSIGYSVGECPDFKRFAIIQINEK